VTRRRLPVRAVWAAAVLLLATLTVGASAAPSRVSLSGSVARFAKPANLVRRVAPSSKVDFELYLGLRDAAGATALLRKVSAPHTATYAHYLTPGQFRVRFARPPPTSRRPAPGCARRGSSWATCPPTTRRSRPAAPPRR
jgi:hypothetical protein